LLSRVTINLKILEKGVIMDMAQLLSSFYGEGAKNGELNKKRWGTDARSIGNFGPSRSLTSTAEEVEKEAKEKRKACRRSVGGIETAIWGGILLLCSTAWAGPRAAGKGSKGKGNCFGENQKKKKPHRQGARRLPTNSERSTCIKNRLEPGLKKPCGIFFLAVKSSTRETLD